MYFENNRTKRILTACRQGVTPWLVSPPNGTTPFIIQQSYRICRNPLKVMRHIWRHCCNNLHDVLLFSYYRNLQNRRLRSQFLVCFRMEEYAVVPGRSDVQQHLWGTSRQSTERGDTRVVRADVQPQTQEPGTAEHSSSDHCAGGTLATMLCRSTALTKLESTGADVTKHKR